MIDRAIYNLLLANSDIANLVGDRISVSVNDRGGDQDYMVLTGVTGSRPMHLDLSPAKKEYLIQVDAYSLDALRSRAMGEAIIVALQGQAASIDGYQIQYFQLVREGSGFEPETKLHRYSLDFMVYYD